MDLDAVADELYGLRPEQFTAARNERAAAARTAGDRTLAEQISGLRRPSLSAWASNLLVHEQPDEIQPLLDLGAALRQAHHDLNGEQLRELTQRQRALTSALSRQAGRLAADAGHPISDDARQEVQDTLQAVLADPDAARRWAAGRLVKPLGPAVGFPAAVRTPPRRSSPPARPAKPPPADREDSAAAERRRKELSQARRAAGDAERELRAREEEAAAAGREAQDAKERLETLRQRVSALTEDLNNAEKQHGQARADERRTRERLRETDRQVRDARSRATTAAAHVERLAAGDRGGHRARSTAAAPRGPR